MKAQVLLVCVSGSPTERWAKAGKLSATVSVHLSHSCSDSLTGAKYAGSGSLALTGAGNALLLQECLSNVLGPAVCLMGFSRVLLSLSSS